MATRRRSITEAGQGEGQRGEPKDKAALTAPMPSAKSLEGGGEAEIVLIVIVAVALLLVGGRRRVALRGLRQDLLFKHLGDVDGACRVRA